jgi:hypothetical protein
LAESRISASRAIRLAPSRILPSRFPEEPKTARFLLAPLLASGLLIPLCVSGAPWSAAPHVEPEFEGKIARSYEDSEEWWPPEDENDGEPIYNLSRSLRIT